MSRPKVFIGMPAFNGADFIEESLKSILAQRFSDYRVLISIDGGDQATASKCLPFLSDPRLTMEVQQARLGWDGNFNWLLSRADCDFFCYWQQDDLTTEDYLAELVRSSEQHPSAVCYYSDIEWFGMYGGKMVRDSVTGFPINRALSIFETMNGIPNRGLIRRSAIERVGPVAANEFGSAFEEYVWIAKLAREGNLHRVRGPTYYKRLHGGAIHRQWFGKSRKWNRQVWIEVGLGMLETIWEITRPDDRRTAFGVVLDRLCCQREGRYMLYDGPATPFAFDFLQTALKRFPVPDLSAAVLSGDQPMRFAGEIGGDIIDAVIDWIADGKPEPGADQGTLGFGFGQAGIDLLDEGWSQAEPWGTWSDGDSARIVLPAGRGETLSFRFTTFGGRPAGATIVVVADTGQTIDSWQVPINVPVTKELLVPRDVEQLTFVLPDAASPASMGASEDNRQLGIGLISFDPGAPSKP